VVVSTNPSPNHPYGSHPSADVFAPGDDPQPPQPKTKTWLWVLLAVVVLLIGGGVATVADFGENDSGTASSSRDGDSADDELTFLGMFDGDLVAAAGEPVTSDGMTIKASSLFSTSDYEAAYLCTTVTIRNDGNMRRTVNVSDWMLQDPNGVKFAPSFGGVAKKLNPGPVAPGGTVSGDMCFPNPPGSSTGQYVVLYDVPFIFTAARIGWVDQR
jgi:hypothetical protein